MDAVRVFLTTQVVIGVLGRELTVRLLEISRAGCLLESSHPVAVGTVGSLVVDVQGSLCRPKLARPDAKSSPAQATGIIWARSFYAPYTGRQVAEALRGRAGGGSRGHAVVPVHASQ